MSIQPKLNRFDLTMIVISLVIGMGIFGANDPAGIYKSRQRVDIFLGAWIFGGLVSLLSALTLPEIEAQAIPGDGRFL